MSIRILRRAALALTTAAICAVPLVAGAGTGETISVNVDQAKLVKMPEKISTIVVGNPMIADVTLQAGGQVVVTGKGYGVTNVISMDRRGEILSDRLIQVESPSDRVVTVYRGLERESYSCSPICERRVTLGDSPGFFKAAMDQGTSLSNTLTASGGKN